MTVLTVNYVVQDGKSNWLEGLILMCKHPDNASIVFFNAQQYFRSICYPWGNLLVLSWYARFRIRRLSLMLIHLIRI